MSKKPISRQKVEDTGIAEEDTTLFKQPEPELKQKEVASSISIPEFLVGEPYPYFYHTWNKLLLCDLNDAAEIFHIYNDGNELEPNVYIYNKQLDGENNDFETQHNKYGNSIQNYYSIVPQEGQIGEGSSWKEQEKININNLTPV